MMPFFLNKNFKKYYDIRQINNKESFCFAADISLHFSFNGSVFPCHNNNTWPLGNIKTQSIYEIWNSENVQKYRRNLKKNKLQKIGCLQCSKDLNQGNYNSINAKRYDFWNETHHQQMPSVMGFRLSDVCNLKCVMCLSNCFTRGDNFTTSSNVYNDSFFEQLEDFIPHLKYAFFLGGEPFVEPLNYRLWEMITEINPGCRIAVQTNGTILNDHIMELMQKGNFDINISVDSISKEIFESIRVNSDYDRIQDNIAYFRSYCFLKNTQFSSCFTPMRMNWHEIPDFIRNYNKTNSTVWLNKYYFPSQFGLWSLSSEGIAEIIATLSSEHFDNISDISEANIVNYNGLLAVLNSNFKFAVNRETRLLNFKSEANSLKRKLLKEIINYISVFNSESTEKYNMMSDKLELMLTYNPQKAYYYFDLLLQTYAGEKLYEVLRDAEEEFLIKEVESVFVK